MLGVEQQPVKTGAGHDLDAEVVGKTAPQADLLLAGLDGVLELVF
jgi:hypothetical protein